MKEKGAVGLEQGWLTEASKKLLKQEEAQQVKLNYNRCCWSNFIETIVMD